MLHNNQNYRVSFSAVGPCPTTVSSQTIVSLRNIYSTPSFSLSIPWYFKHLSSWHGCRCQERKKSVPPHTHKNSFNKTQVIAPIIINKTYRGAFNGRYRSYVVTTRTSIFCTVWCPRIKGRYFLGNLN